MAAAAPLIQFDCYNIDVTVILDQYPSDTTLEITPQGSDIPLYNSIPYDDSLTSQPSTQSICLPEGSYDFVIYDVYGDGMLVLLCNYPA